MAIDDPLAILRTEAFPESANPTANLALAIATHLVPFGGIVDAIQAHYSRSAATERVRMLFECIEEEVRRQGSTLDALHARVNEGGFVQALLDSVDASIRATNSRRIERFAAVLGGTLCESSADWDEAAALISDLARLTERDLQALHVMSAIFPWLPRQDIGGAVSGAFTAKVGDLTRAFRAAGFGWDEFYSHAARLAGFGLAIEVHFNHSKTIEEDANYCFRPTTRGKNLVKLLRGSTDH